MPLTESCERAVYLKMLLGNDIRVTVSVTVFLNLGFDRLLSLRKSCVI